MSLTYDERANNIVKIVKRYGYGKKSKERIVEELEGIVDDVQERSEYTVTNWDD